MVSQIKNQFEYSLCLPLLELDNVIITTHSVTIYGMIILSRNNTKVIIYMSYENRKLFLK